MSIGLTLVSKTFEKYLQAQNIDHSIDVQNLTDILNILTVKKMCSKKTTKKNPCKNYAIESSDCCARHSLDQAPRKKLGTNSCEHNIVRGVRKGQQCGKKCPEKNSFCTSHSKSKAATANNSPVGSVENSPSPSSKISKALLSTAETTETSETSETSEDRPGCCDDDARDEASENESCTYEDEACEHEHEGCDSEHEHEHEGCDSEHEHEHEGCDSEHEHEHEDEEDLEL
jgi:hypothetical protein